MCFLLYAGTINPIPRRSWDKEAPDISVRSLTEPEEGVRAHFNRPEVQCIGSTSCCGCDFPWVMFQGGDWPIAENTEMDEELSASDLFNRKALVELLRKIDEDTVELYGVWAGDYVKEPLSREEINLETILDSDFYLKERGFYEVRLRIASS
jgi:hypothetical protein